MINLRFPLNLKGLVVRLQGPYGASEKVWQDSEVSSTITIYFNIFKNYMAKIVSDTNYKVQLITCNLTSLILRKQRFVFAILRLISKRSEDARIKLLAISRDQPPPAVQ